jgi:hypothetical protein
MKFLGVWGKEGGTEEGETAMKKRDGKPASRAIIRW